MMLPDFLADALARHAADLPAAGAIAVTIALVAAVVLFSGRRRRPRDAPVMGIYPCHSCRAEYAVGLVRLPHERRARLVCVRPDCRVAYAVVQDGDDPADVLRRAREAQQRLMARPVPPRPGARKAALAVVPAAPVPAESSKPDWSSFRLVPEGEVPHVPGPVPMPPPVRSVESDTPGAHKP